MNFDYEKVTKDFLSVLSLRSRTIISRRFALGKNEIETLEKIGKDYEITRERVRQIEADGIKKIKKNLKDFKTKQEFDKIQAFFVSELKKTCGIKKEDSFLKTKNKNYITFLLLLSDNVIRKKEDKDFYALWALGNNYILEAKQVVLSVIKLLKKHKTPLSVNQIIKKIDFKESREALSSIIEISKKIDRTFDRKKYGLVEWPEVYPKTVRDKILLILKQSNEPLHYKEIAKNIDHLNEKLIATSVCNKRLHPQTIHNELIRNENFVLIGRGIYALREWGYTEGQVRDVIMDILRSTKNPLTKEEVISLVSEKRIVKKSTILLNLQNKKVFSKDSTGKYKIRES